MMMAKRIFGGLALAALWGAAVMVVASVLH